MADGAFAASRAVRLLCEWMDRLTDANRIGLRLRDEVLRINHIILNESRTNGLKTATTLSGLLLIENRYYIVHLGDSRIYGYQDGTLELLTTDHSYNGKLTSCLGCTENPIICYNEGASEEKRFLLCSDGLYKRIDLDLLQMELQQLTKKNIKKTIDRLTQTVMECGETDNVSVALVICER